MTEPLSVAIVVQGWEMRADSVYGIFCPMVLEDIRRFAPSIGTPLILTTPELLAAARRVAELEKALTDALELIGQYEAQWGGDYLATKWGLKEEREEIERAARSSEAEGGGR